jgi:hypothetical protein
MGPNILSNDIPDWVGERKSMKKLIIQTKIVFSNLALGGLLLIAPSFVRAVDGVVPGSPNTELVKSNPECSSCPATPIPANLMSFERAEQIYTLGEEPKANQLQGKWKRVSLAKNPLMLDSTLFEDTPDLSTKNGIINDDQSFKGPLSFSVLSSNWTDEKITTVTMSNLGEKDMNQGPYEVSWRNRSACFAQYGYTRGDLDSSRSFTYSCRLAKGKQDRMICSITPEGHNDPRQVPWVGRVVQYYGFVKTR